jgi:hypothetical protein
MNSERVIVDAIKVAQNLLWQNLPSTHNLSDAATVLRFRELVRIPCRTIGVGGQQRHASRVCVASGGACAFRSIADSS